ncbi:ABC1 protein [Metarhizium album ARSEF 1941]|uniref:ABC1 protein n=1 Tax=Metarhizium album (strain ARSEF 1941) TaxID=1081103 RepID=A0A0B2WL12_METAS|nr:ABC1 protein [Metarhizium album ARSEF 1941]KHN94638.1 ABC1 protein [Metarhizium album ARSEF 1941]
MRLADLAIDVAALLSASRSVATKHIALRSRQLDAYSKTSNITTKWRDANPAAAAARSEPENRRPGQEGRDRDQQPTEPVEQSRPRSANEGPEIGTDGPRGAGSAAYGYAEAAQQRQEALRVAAERRDLPEGVDINVFHTTRGSNVLSAVRKGNAASTPPPGGPAKDHPMRHWPPPPPTIPTEATPEEKTPSRSSARGAESQSTSDISTRPVQQPTQPEATELGHENIELAHNVASVEAPSTPAYALRESKVPATRFSRLWNYGGLAAGMLGGAVTESVSRALGGGGQGSVLLSGKNMERMVAKLSRMRGAALKLGQMMSFQDSKMLPAPIQEVLQRVQDRADYMPAWQRDKVLVTNLGPNWRDLFGEFQETPTAAASIGQVHEATLRSSGEKVAVKIQFPGVADSINSDLDNLGMLLNATKLLPKGLYLDKTIDNARVELGWECDYEREARCALRYRELLRDEHNVFAAPNVHLEACGRQVLTMDFMDGVGVTRVTSFTPEQRDWIGTQVMRLCLREITEFRFMQTDPNWTNFLYDARRGKLVLLDFGASRDYPEAFVRQYVQLLDAASRSDGAAIKDLSERLGYLTGHESKTMLAAHTQSILTLAEPFMQSAPEVYDFKDQTITERVKALIPVMLRERLAPPPEETYSLHRKLSGAFLLCARLGSKVPCKQMFADSVQRSGYVN